MKLQIMKEKPELTDEEIERYMDFDGLVKKHQATASFGRVKWIAITLVALGVIISSYFLFMHHPISPAPDSSSSTQPVVPAEVKPDVVASLPDSLQKEKQSPATVKQTEQPAKKHVAEKPKDVITKKEEPAKDVFEEAEPVEGFVNLYNYFNQQLKYPETHLKDKIEGVEIISFVIDETGKPIDLKVVQSLGAAFDEEAIRLVKTMPKWKPAQLNHHPVASKLSLPFTFSLSK